MYRIIKFLFIEFSFFLPLGSFCNSNFAKMFKFFKRQGFFASILQVPFYSFSVSLAFTRINLIFATHFKIHFISNRLLNLKILETTVQILIVIVMEMRYRNKISP